MAIQAGAAGSRRSGADLTLAQPITAKGETTRAAIFQAALDLFRIHGYQATTMRAIAERAGVSLGSSYHYFASKEQLFGRAVANADAAFYAELAAKGGNRDAGEAFYDSWTVLLDKYQLIPEVINYADLSVVDPKYWMRPEYPNSSFDLWFLTKDQKYRRTAED